MNFFDISVINNANAMQKTGKTIIQWKYCLNPKMDKNITYGTNHKITNQFFRIIQNIIPHNPRTNKKGSIAKKNPNIPRILLFL